MKKFYRFGSLALLYALVLGVMVASSTPPVEESGVSLGPVGNVRIAALAVDPSQSHRVLAAVETPAGKLGLFRSEEAGDSWCAHGPALPDELRGLCALSLHPADPDRIYAATKQGGIFLSRDGGEQWEEGGLNDQPVTALSLDPHQPETQYAGTAEGLFFMSHDSGMGWDRARMCGSAITAIVPQPVTGALFAGSAEDGLFRSTDEGRTWVSLGGNLPAPAVTSLALDPLNPEILYLASPDAGVFKSMDGGATWSSMNNGITAGPVAVLAIDPMHSHRLYAGTHWGGVFKSENSGLHWNAANLGLPMSAIKALVPDPSDGNVLYAGVHRNGLFKSADRGFSWAAANEGMERLTPLQVVADPVNPQLLYAGMEAGVFKSTDQGATWAAAGTGLEDQRILRLFLDGSDSAILYAGTEDQGIFKSLTSGETWFPLCEGSLLSVDPSQGGTVYVWCPSQGAIKSMNGGAGWLPINAGLAGGEAIALAVDGANPDRLYLATDTSLFESTNGGGLWHLAGAAPAGLTALALHPFNPTTLFAGTAASGVLISEDSGATWMPLDPILNMAPVHSLVSDQRDGGALYAGTDNGGGRYIPPAYSNDDDCDDDDDDDDYRWGCVYKSVAFQSFLDGHTRTVRNFRDECLLPLPAGAAVVAWYYKISPAVAGFLQRNMIAKLAVRYALVPLIFALKFPFVALASLLSYLVWRRKKGGTVT